MENEKPKLKPCPFPACGSTDVGFISVPDGDIYVTCFTCSACGGDFGTEEKAAEQWNNRTDSVKEQLAEALGCIAAICEKYLLSGCPGGTMVDICSKAAWPLAAYREEQAP